jgi:predicted regulator of Ras-like GTPase activity (Roadblock/LC7/MglB family)/ribosomal protein L37E
LIICQNCGTTNNEASNNVCRKCGALLPASSRSSRTRGKEKKKKQKISESTLELEDIPKESQIVKDGVDLQEIPKTTDDTSTLKTDSDSKTDKSEVLQEIPAQPYQGSIVQTRNGLKPLKVPSKTTDIISNALSELKSSVLEEEKKPTKPLSPITIETPKSETTVLKKAQLEKDMTEVLGFLSKKISVKKLDIPKIKAEEKETEALIPPSNMNEILKRLLKLDLNIEASAIIKTDGTIFASAISSRISDSLFATIGMNLSMIGTDIIEGLDAGTLKSISVRGSDGVLSLAPIDKENPSIKDMILIIFSLPKVKSGIIPFAVNIVKKHLIEYLGLEN